MYSFGNIGSFNFVKTWVFLKSKRKSNRTVKYCTALIIFGITNRRWADSFCAMQKYLERCFLTHIDALQLSHFDSWILLCDRMWFTCGQTVSVVEIKSVKLVACKFISL